MLIASWNVISLKSRLAHVLDWVGAKKPDAHTARTRGLDFRQAPFEKLGYHCAWTGQKAYNAVANQPRTVRGLSGLARRLAVTQSQDAPLNQIFRQAFDASPNRISGGSDAHESTLGRCCCVGSGCRWQLGDGAIVRRLVVGQ
jgi:hypothetical protein